MQSSNTEDLPDKKSGIKQQLFSILESYIQNSNKIPEIPDLKSKSNDQRQALPKRPLLSNQDNMFNIFDLDKLGFVGLKSFKYKAAGDCVLTDFLMQNLKLNDFLYYKELNASNKSSSKCQICHQMSSINFNFGGQFQDIQMQEPILTSIIKIPRDETKCYVNNDKIIKCLGCCISGKSEKDIECVHAICYSYAFSQSHPDNSEGPQNKRNSPNSQKLILLGGRIYYLCQKCLYNNQLSQLTNQGFNSNEEMQGVEKSSNSIKCFYCNQSHSYLQIDHNRNVYYHPVCQYLSQYSAEDPQIWGNQCFKCGDSEGIKYQCGHLECSKLKQGHIICLMKNGYQVLIQNPHAPDQNCKAFFLCSKSDLACPEFFNHQFTRIVERIHSLISTNYEDIIIGERAFHYDMAHYFKAYKKISMNFIDQIVLQNTFSIYKQILMQCSQQIFCVNKEVYEYFVGEENENQISPSDILESNFGYFDYQNFDDTYPLDIILDDKVRINNDNYIKNEVLREETISTFEKGLTQIFQSNAYRLSLPLTIGEFLEFKLDQLAVLTLFGDAFHFLNNIEEDMASRCTTMDGTNSNDHTDTESYMEISPGQPNDEELLLDSIKALIHKFEEKDLAETRTCKALKSLL